VLVLIVPSAMAVVAGLWRWPPALRLRATLLLRSRLGLWRRTLGLRRRTLLPHLLLWPRLGLRLLRRLLPHLRLLPLSTEILPLLLLL
jgi:hypothetical protein